MRNIFLFIGIALLTFTFSFTSVNEKIVVIDVSHGGEDNGASIGNFHEKDIALSIAKKIKELNRSSNIQIVLTRDSDKFISLEDRAKMINNLKPDFAISLHLNFHPDVNKNGTEIYISNLNKKKESCEKLALEISNSFEKEKVEIKQANFSILKNVEYPIALVEFGFLSNENDRKLMTSEEGQVELANSILKAIK